MSLMEHINKGVNRVTPYEPGKPIEEVAREFGLDPNEIVKMASNESPLGVSPLALEAIKNSAEEMNLYPDGSAYYLKQKLSKNSMYYRNSWS